MVSTRTSNKLKKVTSTQEKGKFVNVEDSDEESLDWESLMAEDSEEEAPAAVKHKKTHRDEHSLSTKRKRIAKRLGKGSKAETTPPITHGQPSVEIGAVGVKPERMKAFESRECIGERHVDIMTLRNLCKPFGRLVDEYGLTPICSFPEKTGYSVPLVRSFYLNASNLLDVEDGPHEFRTVVLGTCLTITPQLIGEVIGMNVDLEGTNFMEATFPMANLWKKLVDGLCLPGTSTTGYSALSRQLKLEYRLLNLIICFNILPTLQSKVLRWDRMFFLFLFGHPIAAEGVNFNIPYVIWHRMAKFVKDTHPNERLPFPLIIMRILRKFGIDTASSSIVLSSGTINASTIAKSRSSGQNEVRPMETPTAGPSASTSTSSGEISLTLIHSEQQKLSQELKEMSKKINTIYKLVRRLSATNDEILSDRSESG